MRVPALRIPVLTAMSLACAMLFVITPPISANTKSECSSNTRQSAYVSRIPNGNRFSCQTCHSDGNFNNPPTSTQFRVDFWANGRVWDAALAALDSDGDGVPNGVELQDPTGSWQQGQPAPGNASLVSNPSDNGSTPPATPTPQPTNTPQPTSTPQPTDTPVPPTSTPAPTDTPVPTDTPAPTVTPVPTDTPVPPTATPTFTPTSTPVPPTATPTDTPQPTPTTCLDRQVTVDVAQGWQTVGLTFLPTGVTTAQDLADIAENQGLQLVALAELDSGSWKVLVPGVSGDFALTEGSSVLIYALGSGQLTYDLTVCN